jgi:hypothetical protein
MYFGKTTKDVNSYNGSGKHWKRHLNVHGDSVDTLWSKLFTDPVELVTYALTFSDLNDIVKSNVWANLKGENGLDGGGHHSQETLDKMSSWVRTDELKRKMAIKASIPCTESKKKKIGDAQRGRKYPHKEGAGNASVKILRITSPVGEVYNILTLDLKRFCLLKGLKECRMNNFKDKGKIPAPIKLNPKHIDTLNTIGWEISIIGYLSRNPDVILSSIE